MKLFKHVRLQLSALLVALFVTGCLTLHPLEVQAGEKLPSPEEQKFKFSTFGTLGLVYDDSSLHMKRDSGQPDTFRGNKYSLLADSLLGAQVDYKIANKFDATVQMVVKERARQSFEENLEWAFLRWRPTDDFTLRVGRLGLDLYMLSDYRSVSFAYLWQRPIVEFYGPMMLQNMDGADISYSQKLGDGRIQAKLFGGAADRSLELMRGGGADELRLSSMFGGRLSYEDEQLRLSLGYGRTRIGNNLKTFSDIVPQFAAAAPLWPEGISIATAASSKDRVIQFYCAGAAYDVNNWLLQGEAGYLDSDWPFMPAILSGYVSVGHQMGDFTPYLVLAAAKSQKSAQTVTTAPATTGMPAIDAGLTQLYLGAVQLSRGYRIDQKTLSLGLRWDLYQNVAVKFQWDFSKVAADGNNLWWAPATPVTDTTYVNLLSSSVNVVF